MLNEQPEGGAGGGSRSGGAPKPAPEKKKRNPLNYAAIGLVIVAIVVLSRCVP